VTADDVHPHDAVRVMLHVEPVWGERADLQIDVVIPDVVDSLERLVARSVGADAYELCCLPFALYDLSLGDVVEVAGLTRETPGRVTRVLRPSGRFLFRVLLLEEDAVRMRSLESTFASFGCSLEGYGPLLLAVDTDDEAAADLVLGLLVQEAAQGGLEYETVHAPVT
jgi:hypothetical protein